MSTNPSASRDDEPCPDPAPEPECPPRESGCDPKLIDTLKCDAVGIAEQAKYNATYSDALEQAKTDYETARKNYRDGRRDAALKVQDMRHQIKHLLERIRCLIEQDRVVRCLDEVFCEILEELAECPQSPGCCADDDCEFDVDTDECDCLDDADYQRLLDRIAEYQRHADKAHTCFTTLIGEPAALATRVTAAKAEIDAINADLSADPATTDLKKVYASALVANRHVAMIWNGFDDVHSYVECLCRALTCWTKGCVAVSVLTGAAAVCKCRRDARDAHCTKLRDHTVDEILALYDHRCRPRCDDDSSEHENGCGHDHDRDRSHDRDRDHDRDHDRDRDRDRDRDHDRDRDRDRDRDHDRDYDRDRDRDRDRTS